MLNRNRVWVVKVGTGSRNSGFPAARAENTLAQAGNANPSVRLIALGPTQIPSVRLPVEQAADLAAYKTLRDCWSTHPTSSFPHR
jgi:hypothetical protein